MDRKQEPLRLDSWEFDGLEVVQIEDGGPQTAVAVLADFLNRRHRIDTVGCLTLIVIPVELYMMRDPIALLVVPAVTMVFASFVILIGRRNVASITKAVADDSRASVEGKVQVGETERGDRPELVRGDSASVGTLRPTSV